MIAKRLKYQPRFLRIAIDAVLNVIESKPFVELTVKQYVWGYEDQFLKLANVFGEKLKTSPPDRYGVMLKVITLL